MHDHHGNDILDLLMIAVAGCYFLISIQFFATLVAVWGRVNKTVAISMVCLILVFNFCGLAGYLGKALNFSTKTEIILHIILIACAVTFIAKNQVSVILHGLKDG